MNWKKRKMKVLKFSDTLHRSILAEVSSSGVYVERASCGGSKDDILSTQERLLEDTHKLFDEMPSSNFAYQAPVVLSMQPTIATRSADLVQIVYGGPENISNVSGRITKESKGDELGHGSLVVGMLNDGLIVHVQPMICGYVEQISIAPIAKVSENEGVVIQDHLITNGKGLVSFGDYWVQLQEGEAKVEVSFEEMGVQDNITWNKRLETECAGHPNNEQNVQVQVELQSLETEIVVEKVSSVYQVALWIPKYVAAKEYEAASKTNLVDLIVKAKSKDLSIRITTSVARKLFVNMGDLNTCEAILGIYEDNTFNSRSLIPALMFEELIGPGTGLELEKKLIGDQEDAFGVRVVQLVLMKQRALLIVAEDVEHDVLATLLLYKFWTRIKLGKIDKNDLATFVVVSAEHKYEMGQLIHEVEDTLMSQSSMIMKIKLEDGLCVRQADMEVIMGLEKYNQLDIDNAKIVFFVILEQMLLEVMLLFEMIIFTVGFFQANTTSKDSLHSSYLSAEVTVNR